MYNHTPGPWHIQHCSHYTAICAGEKVIGYIDHFNEHDKKLVVSAPDLLKERDDLLAQQNELQEQIKELQCKLAGCGVAAMQNTHHTIARRIAPGDYGYSASYAEVCRAVDREMAIREQRDELLEALQDALGDLEFLKNAPDSAYARPDDETILSARRAIVRAAAQIAKSKGIES